MVAVSLLPHSRIQGVSQNPLDFLLGLDLHKVPCAILVTNIVSEGQWLVCKDYLTLFIAQLAWIYMRIYNIQQFP